MKKSKFILSFIFLITFSMMSCNQGEKFTYAEIETEFGTMKVKLYNTTPLHRDNFIKLANEGFYNDLLFHRIKKNFMVQGGDPDSKTAKEGQQLGAGGPGYTVPAEIGALHYKGALAAARTGNGMNPDKESSGSQFYIVHGNPVTNNDLLGGRNSVQYSPEQQELYKKWGGVPFLDGEYTVFGMVVEGENIIDSLANVETARTDRPHEDVKMQVRMLK